MGGSGQSTVWKGTAFNCSDTANSIILAHNTDSAVKPCNNGLIVASLINESNNTGYYTSQLNITVSLDLMGQTVECIHDNGSSETSIGNMTIPSDSSNRSGQQY